MGDFLPRIQFGDRETARLGQITRYVSELSLSDFTTHAIPIIIATTGNGTKPACPLTCLLIGLAAVKTHQLICIHADTSLSLTPLFQPFEHGSLC